MNVIEKQLNQMPTDSAFRESFLMDDIKSFLETINDKARIVNLLSSPVVEEEMVSYIKKYNDENTVICAVAYASKTEFPDTEYYLAIGNAIDGMQIEGKKPLPLESILERESNTLLKCGFIDVNDFVRYENQVAFIYPNELGQKVIDAMNNTK